MKTLKAAFENAVNWCGDKVRDHGMELSLIPFGIGSAALGYLGHIIKNPLLITGGAGLTVGVLGLTFNQFSVASSSIVSSNLILLYNGWGMIANPDPHVSMAGALIAAANAIYAAANTARACGFDMSNTHEEWGTFAGVLLVLATAITDPSLLGFTTAVPFLMEAAMRLWHKNLNQPENKMRQASTPQ